MVQEHSDTFLTVFFVLIAIVIPGLAIWLDDAKFRQR